MTKLAGEFCCDLPLEAAIRACVGAIGGLGMDIETVESDRLVAHANGGPSGASPKIEVMLQDSEDETVIEIVGGDSDADPIEENALIAELDRVRYAIETSVENATAAPDPDLEGSAREFPESRQGDEGEPAPAGPEGGAAAPSAPDHDAERRQAPVPQLAAQRRRLRARVDERGGKLTIPVSDLLAEFGLPNFSASAMDTIDALLKTVGLQATPGLGEVSADDSVTLTPAGNSHERVGRNGRRVLGPGWYPDPGDPARLRWWDGLHWTRQGASRTTKDRSAEGAATEARHTAARRSEDPQPATAATQDGQSRVEEHGQPVPTRPQEGEARPGDAAAALQPQTNRLAIASLALSLAWLFGAGSLAAILLGGIAQRRIDRSQGLERGRDLAMAGIVIGTIGAVVTIAVIIALASSSNG